MKAHIGVSKSTKREIDRLVKLSLEDQKNAMTRRVFKLWTYALSAEFGFGRKRIERLTELIRSTLEDTPEDELWRHVDHYVIDLMGLEYEREITDIDGRLLK